MNADPAGPIVIAYDGTEASDHAIREAGALLAGRPALVITVWNEGVGFEMAQDPGIAGVTPAPIDVPAALHIDDVVRERAQQVAQRGADIAAEVGFAEVESLAVADEVAISIAGTIVETARARNAPAIVVAAHKKGRLSRLALGSTSRDVIKLAHCPVVVVREAPAT